jgi:hypothetical protein
MSKKICKQKKLVILPLFLVIVAACEKVVFEPVEIPTEEVSFAADIQPIWDAKCVSCHPPTKDLDLTENQAYDELVPDYVTVADSADPTNSALYRTLVGSSHASRTSDAEKATIQKWISQGAPNN